MFRLAQELTEKEGSRSKSIKKVLLIIRGVVAFLPIDPLRHACAQFNLTVALNCPACSLLSIEVY
jgi:hypothetical protein